MKTFTFLGRYSILGLFHIVSFSLKKRHKLQGESSMLKRISSEKLPQAVGSYSPATEVGNLIFTSGQLPINGKTNKIDFPDSIEEQTKQSMDNVKYILEDNKSSLENIVKTTVYLKNIKDFASFDQVYKSYFTESFPSRTAFEVGDLPMGALIEIEVVAQKIG